MDFDGAARHHITSLHFLLHCAAVMLTYFPDPIVSVKEASPWSGPNFFLRGTTCDACDPLLVLPKCSLPLASAFVGWSSLACELIGLSGRWKSLWEVEWSGVAIDAQDALWPSFPLESTTGQNLERLLL